MPENSENQPSPDVNPAMPNYKELQKEAASMPVPNIDQISNEQRAKNLQDIAEAKMARAKLQEESGNVAAGTFGDAEPMRSSDQLVKEAADNVARAAELNAHAESATKETLAVQTPVATEAPTAQMPMAPGKKSLWQRFTGR